MPKAPPKANATSTTKKPATKPAATKPAVQPAATKKPAAKKEPVQRPVLYPKIQIKLFSKDVEAGELTAEVAKRYLDWEEETEKSKFGANYSLIDDTGKKVRCHNNCKNRPFDPKLARTWQHEILQRRWKLNGESMIVGKSGLNLSCQHRLAGLILAVQEWEKNPERWPEWGDKEPTIPCLIVLGVEEDDATVNTLDTGKPRSLSDVIYRSEYFADLNSDERANVSKIASNAVKLLAYRTGAWVNAFSPRRTHGEFTDLVERHHRILECVRHVHVENGGKNRIGKYLSSGIAAGMLYLMGCAKTNPDSYYGLDRSERRESQLDWDLWDTACNFWVLLAGESKEVQSLREAIGDIIDEGGVPNSRLAVIVKAWLRYADGKKITRESLALEYSENDDGFKFLAELPLVGGIDSGKPEEAEVVVPGDEVEANATSTTEQTAETLDAPAEATPTATKPTATKPAATKATATPAAKPKANGKPTASTFKIGSQVWIIDSDGEPWRGKLVSIDGATARVTWPQTGKDYETPVASLRINKP